MRFNPVISIILGFVMYGVFADIAFPIFGISDIGAILHFIPVIVGGFIATYLAEEKRIQYGIYEGILIVLIGYIFNIGHPFDSLSGQISGILFILILAGIGGIIGIKSRTNNLPTLR